jgi:hypothetical protein
MPWRSCSAHGLSCAIVDSVSSSERQVRVWSVHTGAGGRWGAGNGWDQSIGSFTTLEELLDRLEEARLHTRAHTLGILAHGATMASAVAGSVAISPMLDRDSVRRPAVVELLRRLNFFVPPGGSLIFFSCRAGAGREGEQLLCELSRILPRRFVKAFVSYGFFDASWSPVAGNVTDTLRGSIPARIAPGLPRMYEGCASEKVASDGAIVAWPRIREMWDRVSSADPAFRDQVIDEFLHPRHGPAPRRSAGPGELAGADPFEWHRAPQPFGRSARTASAPEEVYAARYLDE